MFSSFLSAFFFLALPCARSESLECSALGQPLPEYSGSVPGPYDHECEDVSNLQGNIYGLVSCWHHRSRHRLASGALVDDECWNRMIIGGTEVEDCISAVGLS